jgi:hypothetical protein
LVAQKYLHHCQPSREQNLNSGMPVHVVVLVMKVPFAAVRTLQDSHYFVRQAMALCCQLVIPVKTGSSLELMAGHLCVGDQAAAG